SERGGRALLLQPGPLGAGVRGRRLRARRRPLHRALLHGLRALPRVVAGHAQTAGWLAGFGLQPLRPETRRVRLLILVRSFEHGGAQRQIVGLAGGLARGGTPVTVATFYGTGELRGALQQTGVPLVCLDKRSRWDLVEFLGRLRRLVRDARPTVLHS